MRPQHRIESWLPFRAPLETSNLFGHLAATAVPGVEEWGAGAYRTAVLLPGGPAVLEARLPDRTAIPVVLHLSDPADEGDAVARLRRLLDLDLRPEDMDAALSADPTMAPLVAAAPGRRVPGTVDPAALLIRAVIGQQVSTAAARTHAGRLVRALGEPVGDPGGGLTHLFPTPQAIAADPMVAVAAVRMPESRRRTLVGVAQALAGGRLDLTASAAQARATLLTLPGIGPWTADTVLMRALGDADAFLPGDLGVVAAARALGLPDRPRDLDRWSARWSPYRAHAVQYLWATLPHAVNTLPA